MSKYNNRMVVIYYGLKTETSIKQVWAHMQCIVVDNDSSNVN